MLIQVKFPFLEKCQSLASCQFSEKHGSCATRRLHVGLKKHLGAPASKEERLWLNAALDEDHFVLPLPKSSERDLSLRFQQQLLQLLQQQQQRQRRHGEQHP